MFLRHTSHKLVFYFQFFGASEVKRRYFLTNVSNSRRVIRVSYYNSHNAPLQTQYLQRHSSTWNILDFFLKKNVTYRNIICIINTKYFMIAKLETNLIKSEIYLLNTVFGIWLQHISWFYVQNGTQNMTFIIISLIQNVWCDNSQGYFKILPTVLIWNYS